MPFIPNEVDAAYYQQAEPSSADFDLLINPSYGVVYGCEITENTIPDNKVLRSHGGWGNGTRTRSTNYDGIPSSSLTAAHATLPRIDLIYINASQDDPCGITAGIAAKQPVCPAVPSDATALAAVFRPPGVDVITNDMITDKRIFIRPYGIGYTSSSKTLDPGDAPLWDVTSDQGTVTITLYDPIGWDGTEYLIRRNGSGTVIVTTGQYPFTGEFGSPTVGLVENFASVEVFAYGNRWHTKSTYRNVQNYD